MAIWIPIACRPLQWQKRDNDAPHSYREWNIVGQCDVPGFFYLESRFRLNPGEQPATYTAFELCLHESQFEMVQVWWALLIQPGPGMKPIPHSVNLELAGLFKHPLRIQSMSSKHLAACSPVVRWTPSLARLRTSHGTKRIDPAARRFVR